LATPKMTAAGSTGSGRLAGVDDGEVDRGLEGVFEIVGPDVKGDAHYPPSR